MLPPRWSLAPALGRSKERSYLNGEPRSDDEQLIPVPNAWKAVVVANERLTPQTHWQDVRRISFDIPRTGSQRLHCNPGDCLTVYPRNFPEDTQKLITLMGWDDVADVPLDLSACEPLPRNLYVSEPCTLRDIILNNIDFTAIPRRSFLKSMSYFADNPDQKERLLEFTKPEFLDEYFDYATRSRRSILEVLDEFSSVKMPADRILDIFPLIRGRDFSIAGSGSGSGGDNDDITRVDLLVALVKYRTILRKPRRGLCSRYLEYLPLPATVNVTHKPVLSPIHGAANARRPLIAIATGTGLAPIRTLVHERLTHASVGPTLLFFGNRNREADYFFADEWDALVSQGKMHVFLAFSRDQQDKIYVQDLLRQEAKTLEPLIDQDPIFCVCGGSTRMADAAKEAVFEPYTEGREDADERKKKLESMTWWQEIW